MHVLLDANLLILLVAGQVDRRIISNHKRLKNYSEANFDTLLDFIRPYDGLLLTPNTRTEASNLLSQTNEAWGYDLRYQIRFTIETNVERITESIIAVQDVDYLRLGLTDASLLSFLDRTNFLLTSDFSLYLAAARRGLLAQNFNYLRDDKT